MLNIYNTPSKKKEEFEPLKKDVVGIYNCGPTVYDRAHIGNLRSYVFADILRRTLEFFGYEVEQVVNITDVGHLASDGDTGEDKMMRGLKREGMSVSLENMRKIATKYEEIFKEDLEKLNVKTPEHMPRASEHIDEDIEIIKRLKSKKLVYKTGDGLYFDTGQIKDYGKLGGITEEQESRIEHDNQKKSPRDFALWKFSSDLGFDSPWGKGFPGWHIECSAMSRKYLGQPFDIHTGGIDHIPIHHNNEIAQSESAYNEPLAKYWMHNAFLNLNGEKLAKRAGNFITLEDVEKKGFPPLSLRYLLLQTHYRKPIDFSWEALENAQNSLERLHNIMSTKPGGGKVNKEILDKFKEKLEDDLDTPGALALMWEILRLNDSEIYPSEKGATVLEMDKVLKLGLKSSPVYSIPDEITNLAQKREEAKKERDYEKSDKIRKEINKKGFEVRDTDEGSIIIPKNK